jgi:Tol biopolymer transport system component
VTFARCVHAVACDQEGVVNIYVMRSDGSHVRALTHCSPGSDCLGSFTPSFSPDGRLIVFARDQLNSAGVNFQGIFVMRRDGTHLRRVTSNGPNNLPDAHPRFSPDGHRLVFDREIPGGRSQLFTVNVNGKRLRKVLPGVTGFFPDWAPRGHRIAFTWSHASSPADTVLDVATVHIHGRHPRPLTATADTGTFAFAPDYSPNGTHLVLSRSDGQGCTLVTVSVRGGTPRPVRTGGGCTVNASWSMRASRIHR